MPKTKITQRLAKALTLLAVLLLATPALADRVVWKKTKINESNESWRIDVEIYLSKAPDIAHVPMQFKFEPYTYYERSLVDGSDEPQLRKVPLQDKQPLIESVDMGFLDSGSGKIQSRTRFSFKLTRERGFEAGEYKVSIKNKRSNRTLTPSTTLTLDGENEVIDRRSMVFDTNKADKKKAEKREEENKAAMEEYEQREDPNSEEFWEGGPEEPEKDDEPLPPPAHMQDKPGACGCRIVGANGAPTGLTWLVVAFGLALTLRRRA